MLLVYNSISLEKQNMFYSSGYYASRTTICYVYLACRLVPVLNSFRQIYQGLPIIIKDLFACIVLNPTMKFQKLECEPYKSKSDNQSVNGQL